MRHVRRASFFAAIALIAMAGIVRAQDDEGELGDIDLGAIQAIAPPGLEGSPYEIQAWTEARALM